MTPFWCSVFFIQEVGCITAVYFIDWIWGKLICLIISPPPETCTIFYKTYLAILMIICFNIRNIWKFHDYIMYFELIMFVYSLTF